MKAPAVFSLLLFLALRADTAPAPLSVPPHVVYKPTFMTGQDSFSGGTAFLCSLPDSERVLLLTAHHLFGPACGLERDYSWTEMPKAFVAVTGLSIADPKHAITSTTPLTIPGAQALNDSGYSKDVAGYELTSNPKPAALKLAKNRPRVGERLFLYARQRGKQTLELIPCTVTKSSPTELEYDYGRGGINLGGTSGAPVLNAASEVVAINLGGGENGGKVFGMGNPCTSVLELLKGAK